MPILLGLRIFGGILALWITGGVAIAQMEHHELMDKEHTTPLRTNDSRVALSVQPAIADSVRLTMREHLDALRALVAALAQEEYESAAVIAHEDLGFPKHHQAMMREQGAMFPPKYQELAMAHHQEAENLAQIIPSKDLKRILPHLERTMKACVACHETYKL
jgi:hypothetical protein